MDTQRLVSWKELAPIFEIFLWVYWARERDVDYWTKQINRAAEPDDRSLVGKIWDAAWNDDDTVKRAWAEGAVEQLDPILARMLTCGIKETEITQFEGGSKSSRRFLNILMVKTLGTKHRGTLLGDLIANLDSKSPTSALDGKPVDKTRPLK
jgi:hypothetical protein